MIVFCIDGVLLGFANADTDAADNAVDDDDGGVSLFMTNLLDNLFDIRLTLIILILEVLKLLVLLTINNTINTINIIIVFIFSY